MDSEEVSLILKALEGNPILDKAWDVSVMGLMKYLLLLVVIKIVSIVIKP